MDVTLHLFRQSIAESPYAAQLGNRDTLTVWVEVVSAVWPEPERHTTDDVDDLVCEALVDYTNDPRCVPGTYLMQAYDEYGILRASAERGPVI